MRCIYNAHYSNKNTLRPFHSIIHNVYTMPVHLFNCPALCRRTTHSIATGIHLLPTPTGAYFGLAWNGRLLPSVSVIDEAGDIQWKLSSRCICVAMENQLGRRIPCLGMAACVWRAIVTSSCPCPCPWKTDPSASAALCEELELLFQSSALLTKMINDLCAVISHTVRLDWFHSGLR